MKRTYVLGMIVIAGAVAAAAANVGAQQPPAGGQGRQGGGGAAQELGKIEKVADNLYFVFGRGGNTGVYIAEKGVVLVDTKNPDNGQGILDRVKSVTDKPITHIINTHTHGDHNGSNIFFPASVEIVTQENTAANMQKMAPFQEAANKHGLPDRTYKDKMTLLNGKDAIDLYYFGPAHTNGDTFVVFRTARVVHAGDAFANKGQPLIDRNNGGSGIAYPETIRKAANGIKNVDVVINGHSPVTMKFQDLVDFGEFNRLFLEHARASLKAGKTPEQAMMDLKLPEKFKDYNLTGGRGGPGGNFGVIFTELQEK
ncbi:MAG TPA: MBL fold metallo-hydrolase [Vicinamibacterales bacterium]|jgi:glyoxylase-like metal-dependent hydrolase (beta-lactamase superfamily II)|nr:MBL fold metallo-hydrolase [Vicinamibacterales bacterium]